MKKSSFISNLIRNLKKWLGWCPEAPEPTGFRKFVNPLLVYIPVFNVRLVQLGLIIGVLMQTIVSILVTVYVAPTFLALIERVLISPGSFPPEEAVLIIFSLFPIVMLLTSIIVVSSGIAGYMVGKNFTKFRYGIIVGITNILLGYLVIFIISYLYITPSFYAMYDKLLNLGIVSNPSITDIVVGRIQQSFILLAMGGGGGVVGQFISLHLEKTNPTKQSD